ADGVTVGREVRPHYHQPILMLTARTEYMDQVLGLEMGSDDFVAKPVQPRVLLERMRALLRRTDKSVEDKVAQRIEFDDIVTNNGGRYVTLN
ncbi:response regulator, partial [Acinetobacter baumannii]|uniref:response regulator n=1 Tax=Acinetobacter baumannii TaxID=470 RepID=UPI000ABAB8E1